MKGRVQHTREWPATWTWAAPRTVESQTPIRGSRARTIVYRRRLVDYALAEPRLFGEVMRRGFLEGA